MTAFLLFISLAFASVSAHGAEVPLNYKDIHGVTQEEIDSIEALKARGRSFSYAGSLSSETFAGKDQQIMGFTAHLCRLLSQLFEARFVPAVYDWEEMVNGMVFFFFFLIKPLIFREISPAPPSGPWFTS
jgi:hypothetical protein